MATVNKNFKVKHGLVVEGSTATVNGNQVLSEDASDQYILDLIGGETLIKSVSSEFDVSVGGELSIDRATVNAYYDPAGAAADALADANSYTDGAVSALVNGAPELLDTLNELAAAINDDASFASTIATSIGGKQDTLTAGDNIDITGATISVTGLDSADISDFNTAALSATSAAYDPAGAAATAQGNAEDYTDTALEDYTPTASLDTTVAGYGYAKTADLPTMYSDADVDAHLSGGDGITYSSGAISADLGTGLKITVGQIAIDRAEVDTYYDPAGAAATAQSNAEDYADGLATNYEVAGAVSTHNDLTTGVHGVTGDVVGTTDTQDISNKRVIDTLYFSDGVTISEEGEIAVRAVSHDFDIQANQGDLHLKTVHTDGTTGSDVQITSTYGDILLNATGAAYYGSASAENEIATHGYVDNAISGLDWKTAVHLLYDAAIPTMSGSGASQLIIDGHDPLGDADSGYRILITQSSNAGIHVFNSTSGNWTLTRAEDADVFGELIGAAVYVMEGTQYGSTSWVQGNHYLTDFTGQTWTQFSGQGSVTAGDGITVDGLEVSIDRTTVDDWYDASGAAAAAQTAAEGFATGLDNTTNGRIDDLNTDDISEGATNFYFTDTRAKISAADLITNATKTNITITGDENGLTITAENGVDDSDTDDLDEGTTNLYFTDSRAVDALEAVVPNFTAIELNSLAKQVASTIEVATASQVTAYSWEITEYRSAKFLIQTLYGNTNRELTEVLITTDSLNNVAMTEYATVGTNGSSMTVTAVVETDMQSTKVKLKVTTLNNTSVVTVMGTLIA
jgi:hypothetical protein